MLFFRLETKEKFSVLNPKSKQKLYLLTPIIEQKKISDFLNPTLTGYFHQCQAIKEVNVNTIDVVSKNDDTNLLHSTSN